MNPSLWVGIHGPARSGKDTAGKAVAEKLGLRQLAFATPMKDMALRIDPMVATMRCNGHHVHLSEVVERFGWEEAKRLPEVRRFIQRLGAEGLREYDPDFWVDLAEQEAASSTVGVVFTDVRYPNEAELIRRHNGVLLSIRRSGLDEEDDYRQHSSESFYDELPYDLVLVNNCTPEELGKRAVSAVRHAITLRPRRPA